MKYPTKLMKIQATEDFYLIAEFSDGTVVKYDFNRIFDTMPGDSVQALRSLTLFKTVTVEHGDAHWENDFDLSGDSIYQYGEPYKVSANSKI